MVLPPPTFTVRVTVATHFARLELGRRLARGEARPVGSGAPLVRVDGGRGLGGGFRRDHLVGGDGADRAGGQRGDGGDCSGESS